MRYDDKIFYHSRDEFIKKITNHIENELEDKQKYLKKVPNFSKSYFITAGEMGALQKIKTSIYQEKHKVE